MNMQLHEKKFGENNRNKVFVDKYMDKKNRWFVKAMNLKRFILPFVSPFIPTGMIELLGILGAFKMAEYSYPSSPRSKPWSLSLHYSNFPISRPTFISKVC